MEQTQSISIEEGLEMIHYTYPHAQQICCGCRQPMPYEIIVPPPMLKLAVTCENAECQFKGIKFEVLPTLLKPAEDDSKIKLVTQ